MPRWLEASRRADAQTLAKAEKQAALERQAAARPFLDRGRAALGRLDPAKVARLAVIGAYQPKLLAVEEPGRACPMIA